MRNDEIESDMHMEGITERRNIETEDERGEWNPSWEKGTIDLEVIDPLIEVRKVLSEIKRNGFAPNYEQTIRLKAELTELWRMVR